MWTVVLPYVGNYSLEETEDVLDDGTTVTVLARVPKDYQSPEQLQDEAMDHNG